MNDTSAHPLLTPIGCLIEKQVATPGAYPQTVNAMQVAAKTARDRACLRAGRNINHALRQQPALVECGERGAGQRKERYAHLLSGLVDLAWLSVLDMRAGGGPAGDGLGSRVVALEADVTRCRPRLRLLAHLPK